MRITVAALRSVIKEVLHERRRLVSEARGSKTVNGTIYLPTPSAIAVWKNEILGQMSDGAWENTNPQNHWEYWSDLNVQQGAPGLKADRSPVKTGYNLAGLLQYVGDRMVAYGRMGKALGASAPDDAVRAAEYMPETLEQWQQAKQSNNWQYDFVSKYMGAVTEDMAKKFYNTTYTERDLRRDLSFMKTAMKGGAPGPVPGKSGGASIATGGYYELNDGKSHKFWSYNLNGPELTVNYGRIGTSGATKVKKYSSPEEAELEAQKLVTSKVNKGYSEATKGGTAPKPLGKRGGGRSAGGVDLRAQALAKLSPEERAALGL